jgi:hypothetical protein
MKLTREQSYALLEKHGCYVTEACDKCGQILSAVRYTRKNESGDWCSRECRGDAPRPAIRKGGRPRKHKTNAERQRAYRNKLSVTKLLCSVAETKDLQVQKTSLSQYPLNPCPKTTM